VIKRVVRIVEPRAGRPYRTPDDLRLPHANAKLRCATRTQKQEDTQSRWATLTWRGFVSSNLGGGLHSR